MTYTLSGRLQTRLIILGGLGAVWTALITAVLPTRLPLGASYRTTFTVLALLVALGVLWECLYHLVQQRRWDRDWPQLLTLVAGLWEGLALWALLGTDTWFWDVPVTGRAFWLQIGSTWLLYWLVLIGPVRVLLTDWRYRGGRILR